MSQEAQTYNLVTLQDNPNHTFELRTRSNSIVPISIKGLKAITQTPEGKREPNTMELIQLANVALGQGADPYAKECGLLPVFSGGFRYEPWVAAQVRMSKAQAQPDYDGYQWGWITKDFTRHESGRQTKANPKEIIGAWGEVKRKGLSEPFYHEVFLDEVSKAKADGSGKGSWDRSPLTMLAKVIRDQTHKFAYADKMGNLNTEDELRSYSSLPMASCDTPSRENRRKPAQDVHILESEPSPVTEESTDAEGDGFTLNDVLDKFCQLSACEGDAHEEFTKWAAFVLCLELEEVDTPDKFTPQMVSHLMRELETNGVAK